MEFTSLALVVLSYVVFYLIIKAAVRNGSNASELARHARMQTELLAHIAQAQGVAQPVIERVIAIPGSSPPSAA